MIFFIKVRGIILGVERFCSSIFENPALLLMSWGYFLLCSRAGSYGQAFFTFLLFYYFIIISCR
jgi:hypothetical protein